MTHIKRIDEMVNDNTNNGITYFNEDKPIKIGGRKAPKGGREKLEYVIDDDQWKMIDNIVENPKVEKDLSKYNFDNENLEYIGIQTTETGLDFMVFETGGDWEDILYFFVYWDGKGYRGYVPTRGNAVNTLNKSAFGNGEENTVNGVNGDKLYFDTYGIPYEYDQEGDYVDVDDLSDYRNLDMCIDEFTARVEVEGAPHYTPKTQVRGNYKVKKVKPAQKAKDIEDVIDDVVDEPAPMVGIDIAEINGKNIWYDIVPFDYNGKTNRFCLVLSNDGKTISSDEDFNGKVTDIISIFLRLNKNGNDDTIIEVERGRYVLEMFNKTLSYDKETERMFDEFIEKMLPSWKRFQSQTASQQPVQTDIKPQNPNIMVYWNVVYFRDENEWLLLIDKFSGRGLSDDSNFTSKVYELIENALPEYHLSEEMESVCTIYPKDANGKYDWEKPLRTKQDAEIFAEKLQRAFPKWKRERAKR